MLAYINLYDFSSMKSEFISSKALSTLIRKFVPYPPAAAVKHFIT